MIEKAALLPVWFIVKQSYKLAWRNRAQFFTISWWWLILAILVMLVSGWIQQSSLSVIYCFDLQRVQELHGHLDPHPVQTFLLSIVPSILMIGLGASIAVAWHRLILRGEIVTESCYLRFDTVVIHYF